MVTTTSTHPQQGFLLNRSCQDITRNGVTALVITLWLKTAQGATKLVIENEQALFFIEKNQLSLAEQVIKTQHLNFAKLQHLSLKAFNQQEVVGVYFNSLRDFYTAKTEFKAQGIKCYEDDLRPDDRFLMERFITADIDFIGEPFGKTPTSHTTVDYQQFISAKCKASAEKSTINLTMLSIDIECSMASELYSIGCYGVIAGKTFKRVLMIGQKPETQENTSQLDYIHWLDDEKQLLQAFIDTIMEVDADIIIGWNVINFDFSVLQKRYDLHGIKFSMGRDGKAPYWRKNKNSEQHFIEISGRVILDGIDLLKTATYHFPSFSLDNVANTLLGIGKKVENVDNRIQEITDNFNHNKPALAAYNLEDCRLVWLIFEKTQLLEFAILRAQLTGLNIDRIGGSVAAFTNLYLPKLHRSGYVAPNMGDGTSDLISPGGYVMNSTPGLYNNVLVLDFKSLYPSIIRTFNIDPMGLIEGMKNHENYPETCVQGFDGAYFSRKKHFLPDIIQSLWQERDKAKQEKNSALSQAIKIIMNSFYGVLGSTGCRFFDPRLSGSITKRSHEILKITQSWIEQAGYQVIYGDTDSIFIHVKPEYDSRQCKTIGIELQTSINKQWQQKLKNDFQVVSELEIEFETHFSKFLMPTIRGADVRQSSHSVNSASKKKIAPIGTKKRYAGLVCKNGKNELVFKGMETVRSDWTELSKIFQQALYKRIFNNQPFEEYIADIVKKTLAGQFDDLLIYRKRIRRKLVNYVKNVPPHVKAARMADTINKKLNKPLKYQNKAWIEYVITLDGPQAVEYATSPLDYDFYVDRQLKTVANDILPFVNSSFEKITDKQLDLF